MQENKSLIFIFICWGIALVATAGSLFFSEVMEFTPCSLCWYQRIAMYPLVLLFGVGLFQELKETVAFSLPVVVIGWLIAVYHNLVQFGVIPESASPCRLGISCSSKYINWFGFITIPMLSMIAFSILLIIMILLMRSLKNEK